MAQSPKKSTASPTRAPRKKPQAGAEVEVRDPSVNDPPMRVLRRFRVVFNAVKAHFRQVEKTTGVGGAQLWALAAIRAQPGMGVNELSVAMDVHQSTASNLAKSLSERGLVVIERNGPDRRAVTLKLTSAGSKAVNKAPGPLAGVLPEALATLDARTLDRLDADLGKVIAALGADERAAGIPLGQQD